MVDSNQEELDVMVPFLFWSSYLPSLTSPPPDPPGFFVETPTRVHSSYILFSGWFYSYVSRCMAWVRVSLTI